MAMEQRLWRKAGLERAAEMLEAKARGAQRTAAALRDSEGDLLAEQKWSFAAGLLIEAADEIRKEG